MCEYNIANILSLEKFEKKKNKMFSVGDIKKLKDAINKKFEKLSNFTFGQLKKKVSNSLYLSGLDMNALGKIVDYRNYLVHKCFKEKLMNDELSSLDSIDRFVDELNDFEEQVASLNAYLAEVFKQNKTKEIWLRSPFWE